MKNYLLILLCVLFASSCFHSVCLKNEKHLVAEEIKEILNNFSDNAPMTFVSDSLEQRTFSISYTEILEYCNEHCDGGSCEKIDIRIREGDETQLVIDVEGEYDRLYFRIYKDSKPVEYYRWDDPNKSTGEIFFEPSDENGKSNRFREMTFTKDKGLDNFVDTFGNVWRILE